jgi:uncharacterized protein YecE (DUF72 family)
MIECRPYSYDTLKQRERMPAEVLIGCAGYSYEDWQGLFYPPDLPANKRLEYYARHFPLVEVNFTFYRMPTKSSCVRAYERTEGQVTFNVKLHQDFTHTREISEKSVAEFTEAVKPLVDEGIFGCLLAQFPFSFRLDDQSLDWLEAIRDLFEPLPLAVEFRNAEWAEEEVYFFLKQRGLIFCIVDEPKLRGLMPPVTWVTGDTAYIRFHGRNAALWWDPPDSSLRYDYLYNEDELAEWVKKIVRIQKECEKLYVIMNNHFSGNAVRNAKSLQMLLGLDTPPLENHDTGKQEMLFE